MVDYLKAIAIGFDVLINAIFGGQKYQTLSCRIGLSIANGGWASHIPWPALWRAHFASAVYQTIV